jgi:uncharacterized protein
MRLFAAAVAVLVLSLTMGAFAGETSGPRVLIVGGGSSHDFNKWFNLADVATLKETTGGDISYTDKIDSIKERLKDIDVLYLSNNQPMTDPELRKAIFDFADAGKGIVLVHAALWYNWGDWPEYNKTLVGGGSRGHDAISEFEVTALKPEHPLLKGVSHTFKVTDELYYYIHDDKGAEIEPLTESKSSKSGKTFTSMFIVKHPKARIVGITLGHDGRAHDLPEYKQILTNAVMWAAGK